MVERLINQLMGIIVDPVSTLSEISREKPVGWGLAVYILVVLLSTITSNGDIPSEFMPWIILILIPAVPVILFINVGIYQIFARLFGGRGNFWGLFSGVSFSAFVYIFMPPLNLLSQVGGMGAGLVTGILIFGLGIWNLVLDVIAVRETHELSTGMSVLTVLLPLVVFTIIGVILFIVGAITLFMFFSTQI